MRLQLLIISAACVLAVTACVEPSSGTPSSADLADFGVQSSVTIEVDDDGFRPSTLELPANSTVTVTNVGTERHAVLQLDTRPDRRIETGDLVPGEAVDVHVAAPGEIELTDPRTDARLSLDVGPPEPLS